LTESHTGGFPASGLYSGKAFVLHVLFVQRALRWIVLWSRQEHRDRESGCQEHVLTSSSSLGAGTGSKVKRIRVDELRPWSVNDGMHDASLGCSQLARLTGVSPDTIRHYDRRRLLPGSVRTASGYRRFPRGSERRVATIRAALAVGFSLDELSDFLHERDRGGLPCQRVRRRAEEKLRQLEEQLRDLQALKRRLQRTLKDWDTSLARTAPHRQARLLDGLIAQ
jgi:DNA-binding transcriptional MerR regulator